MWPHSDEWSLDSARVSCSGHMIWVVISPHLIFSALTASLPFRQEKLTSSSTFSIPLGKTTEGIPSRCYDLFLFLWQMNYWVFGAPTTLSGSGRALNERQTPRHPLATLNVIRLVSFLQQGTLDQGLMLICLDKILICLMNLVLQESQV